MSQDKYRQQLERSSLPPVDAERMAAILVNDEAQGIESRSPFDAAFAVKCSEVIGQKLKG